jgi:hypothetical protein
MEFDDRLLHKMYQCRSKAKNYWWWAERLPETCRVVTLIKLEFSASVGFIHKEHMRAPSEHVLLYTGRLIQCEVGTYFSSVLPKNPMCQMVCIYSEFRGSGSHAVQLNVRKFAERKWLVRTRRTGTSDTVLCRQWWRSSYMTITIENWV